MIAVIAPEKINDCFKKKGRLSKQAAQV